MSKRRYCLCYFLLGLFISSCAELPKTNHLTVAGLTFHNTTSSTIRNARLTVHKTHGTVACGFILPYKECSTTFPQRQYQGNAITVSWQQSGQSWTATNVAVQLPEYPIPNRSTIALISLGENGSISARLIQPASGIPRSPSLQPE
jgi:hypothetical protein